MKEIGGRLLKRIDGWKVARRAGGFAFNVITGLPSPDQITTAFESIQALAGSVKSMSPADIEGKLTELGGFLKPTEERSIPEQIHHFRDDFKELPVLTGIDLRPYVFVAREKRLIGAAEAGGALDILIETLAGTWHFRDGRTRCRAAAQ